MSDSPLVNIEKQLDLLIAKCQQLAAENQRLRDDTEQWQHERTRLIEKNEMACTRIEAMIARLKRLEIPST